MASCINTQKADLIIYNGVIYTVDSNFSIAQAMAVRDGKIMAIGTNEEIRMKYAAPMMTDLMNHPVYPGFIDAHCHFLHYGLDLGIIDLVGTKSYSEVLKRVMAYAETDRDGWIVGRGWDQNDWAEQRFPDKASLDSL
ncbi:MAG: amidohydrolase family protein, partial [Flavobacteriales bacterium]